ncbi:MAG: hypothetical protein OXG61_08185 [Chloroflexi bacterium]|nr:hypothetical protein [Chloroflexota bacterium]
MSEWQQNSNPVMGEFFSATSDLPERLVREAIQNSMDARFGKETVRVRFTFSGELEAALPLDLSGPYVDGLEPHIQAAADSDGDASSADDPRAALKRPLSWLAVEDFGTSGLVGDVESNDIMAKDNHFWGFFRQSGISPKGEDSAGSWGLGKWVFPDASAINSYIAVTERRGERRILLMGATVLKTHRLDGVRYPPEGYFTPTGTDQQDSPPLPVDSDSDPDDFILKTLETFRLDRTAAPGLSVIVLHPKNELNPSDIARAVLTQYFLPIVRGDLTVEIIHPEEQRTIDKASITKEVAGIGQSERDDESPESLLGAIQLAEWGIRQEEFGHIKLPANAIAKALADHDLDYLRERYERGERLAFRLTTVVQRKSKEPTPDAFRVYIERAPELQKGHDYFVRGYLRVPREDHIQNHSARALVVVDEKSELGHLLRDAEGPAHERWQPRKEQIGKRWESGESRVRNVQQAAATLLQRVIERPAESLTHALAHWFPASAATSSGSQSGTRGGGGTVLQPTPPPPPPKPLEIVRAKGGFAVRARGGDNALVGTEWTVRFAYDSTGRGGPFRQFERGVKDGTPDFSLTESLQIESTGCEYDPVGQNEFTLHVNASEFRIAVSGFDGRRDVLVDVQAASEVAIEAQEVAS